MARVLRNLQITRVALVDKGANLDVQSGEGSHIMLWKRDVAKETLGQVHVDRPVGAIVPVPDDDQRDEYEKATLDSATRNALPDSAFAAVWTDRDGKKQRKLPYKTASGGIDAPHLRNALARIAQEETQIPDAVRSAAKQKLESAMSSLSKEFPVKSEIMKRLLGLFKETDVVKRDAELDRIAKEMDDVSMGGSVHDPNDPNCTCAKCMMAKAHTGDDEVGKRVNAEVAKRMVDVEKRIVEAEARATAAEVVAKAERSVRKRLDMVTVMKSFRSIPLVLEGEKSDVDRFLKMQESSPDEYGRMIEVLRAADAQLVEGMLYKNVGSGRAGEGSAWAQIEAKADGMIEKNASLTREQAIDRVMDQHPSLVKQYRAEQQ